MLHPFGATTCPRCTTQLVHEDEFANDWMLPAEQVGVDQRWLCPGCGYARPVTYLVDRPSGPAASMAMHQQPPSLRRQGFFH